MEHTDYYQVLGVDKHSTAQQIKDAYRHLAFKYHPDRNKDQSGKAEKMKIVNEAYAVLSNPDRRREYDALRQQFGSSAYGRFRQSYTDHDIFHGSDVHHIFEEMARSFGLRGFNDIFRDFYGSGFQSFEIKGPGMRGRGYRFTVRGSRRNGSMFAKQRSGRSGRGSGFGMGRLSRFLVEQLADLRLPVKGGDLYDTITIDSGLAENGGAYAYFHRHNAKKLIITIPADIKEGQKIRLAGMGTPGRGGAEAGDLYIQVKFRKPLAKKLKGFFQSIVKS